MLPSSFQISKSPVVHFDRDADDDAKYIENYVDEGDYNNEDADDAEVLSFRAALDKLTHGRKEEPVYEVWPAFMSKSSSSSSQLSCHCHH